MYQFKYFLLTIKYEEWRVPDELDDRLQYLCGQEEVGEGGYRHWQLYVVFKSKITCTGAKRFFPPSTHVEATRSAAARDYVRKAATSVGGTFFQLGRLSMVRSSQTDWDGVWASATGGRLLDVPSNVRVQHYRTLRTIRADYAVPEPMERQVFVYWGRTGTGKSRKAWQEAGWDAYPKDPRSKFWDGYAAQQNVVIDEFRGGIDIAHVLRWLDRYPVLVEIKGSSVPLVAKKIYITSNLNPSYWYPELDEDTRNALLRRLNITYFDSL